MHDAKKSAAHLRFNRESQDLCPACGGTGRLLSHPMIARAVRGGNASYLASLQPKNPSMADRGRLGGRPKEKSLDELGS